MDATSILSSNHPLLAHEDLIPRRCYRPINPRRRMSVITSARQGENDDQGQQQQEEAAVNEENKIVLKMRIKKPKALESSNSQGSAQPQPPPSSLELKEWERKEFLQYEEGVFDLMELLQGSLMKTRPSVAVGFLALLALSVPLSSSVVTVNVLKIVRGLLAGCHGPEDAESLAICEVLLMLKANSVKGKIWSDCLSRALTKSTKALWSIMQSFH